MYINIFIFLSKFIIFSSFNIFRSQQSTNVQTTEIVYDQNSVQTIETRNVEVHL